MTDQERIVVTALPRVVLAGSGGVTAVTRRRRRVTFTRRELAVITEAAFARAHETGARRRGVEADVIAAKLERIQADDRMWREARTTERWVQMSRHANQIARALTQTTLEGQGK